MINDCLNMVGGECISRFHMVGFVFGLVTIGFIGGWVLGRTTAKKIDNVSHNIQKTQREFKKK